MAYGKIPREQFGKVAKRAMKRWGKILTGAKPALGDISQFNVPANTPYDPDFYREYVARRNAQGGWDLFSSLTNVHTDIPPAEQLLLKDAKIEQVVDYIWSRQPQETTAELYARRSELRHMAALANYFPPETERGKFTTDSEAGHQHAIKELKKILGR